MANRQQLNYFAQQAASKYGVPIELVNGVIQQESGWNPNAKSQAGALGLMQLMPSTAAGLGVKNPYDPQQNIDGGVRYLAKQLKQFKDPRLALAAYNAGPGAVLKYGNQVPPYKETQNYVNRILGGSSVAKPNLKNVLTTATELGAPPKAPVLPLLQPPKAQSLLNDVTNNVTAQPRIPIIQTPAPIAPESFGALKVPTAPEATKRFLSRYTYTQDATPQPNTRFGLKQGIDPRDMPTDAPVVVLGPDGMPKEFKTLQEAQDFARGSTTTTRNMAGNYALRGAAGGALLGPIGAVLGAGAGAAYGAFKGNKAARDYGTRIYRDSRLVRGAVEDRATDYAAYDAFLAPQFEAMRNMGIQPPMDKLNEVFARGAGKDPGELANLIKPVLDQYQGNIKQYSQNLDSNLSSIVQQLEPVQAKIAALQKGGMNSLNANTELAGLLAQEKKLKADMEEVMASKRAALQVSSMTPEQIVQARYGRIEAGKDAATRRVLPIEALAGAGNTAYNQSVSGQNAAGFSADAANYGAGVGAASNINVAGINANAQTGVAGINADALKTTTRDTNNTAFVRDQQQIQAATAAREQEAAINTRAQKYIENMVVQRQQLESQVQDLINAKGVQKALASPEYRRLQEETARLDALLGGSGVQTREQVSRGLLKPLTPLESFFNGLTVPFGGEIKTQAPIFPGSSATPLPGGLVAPQSPYAQPPVGVNSAQFNSRGRQ